MSSPKRPLQFLIIDDDMEYFRSLYSEWQRNRIILKYAETLEDGKRIIESNEGKKISGVILDVICLKDREQEVPHKSFIKSATKYFEKNFPELPIAILTGEPDEFTQLKEFYKGELNVYSKGRDEDDMCEFLKKSALNLDRNKIMAHLKNLCKKEGQKS
jgi:ActR/RegA family two-component response regulator